MRNFFLIVLAISMFYVCSGDATAQTAAARNDTSSTVTTTPSDAADDPTFAPFERVTNGIKPPKATSAPDPKFPVLPPDAEQHGTVVLLIGVTAKGHVDPVRVLRSDEPAFEKTAVATVKKWKFKPAEKSGRPVPVQVTVEMKF